MHLVRQPRSPAARALRRLQALHAEADRAGVPAREPELAAALARTRPRADPTRSGAQAGVSVARAGGGQTRRELLAGGAALAAAAALAARPVRGLAAVLPRREQPRIAIVGCGLAGLRCAHLLWSAHGLAADLYEANPARIGGRCWTLRGYFGGGLTTEHGGSFIDTVHVSVRRLARELGLQLEVVGGGDLPSGEDIYFIDGHYYTHAEASEDWAAVGFRAFRDAARELEGEAGEQRLDALSVPAWLDSTPIGAGSRLGKLLLANTVTENGGDPGDQSALDLIQITAGSPRGTLELLPGDDERYHVIGGNDQLVAAMAAQLPAPVSTDHRLLALRARSGGGAALVFEHGGRTVEERADLVVLALPFSTLREADLSVSGLSAAKRRAIDTLGMGTNAKLHVELTRKTWPPLGFAGAAYSEWDGFCCAWDDSVPQGANARPALLLGFPGGRVGAGTLTGEAHGPAPFADRDWLLRQIEPVFPGTVAAATGRAYEDHWALDPYVHGAYSFYRVGQAASYGALAARAEAPYHFAGEHTSSRFQGFLEGAVESGERAARELVRLS